MKTRVSLEEIRSAITNQKLVSFDYEGTSYRIEPQLLGHSPRYRAFVVVGRSVEDENEWKAYRYAMIANWNVFDNEKFDPWIEIPGKVLRCVEMIDRECKLFCVSCFPRCIG